MLMAAWLISAGYKVAYEPSASVFHSHNLSPKQQFNRNRAIGQFLEEHADDLLHASEIGEGGRLVKSVARTLLSEGQISEFFAFGVDCAARLLGNRAGRKIAHNDAKGKA
jgi:rhamnosyltransferase